MTLVKSTGNKVHTCMQELSFGSYLHITFYPLNLKLPNGAKQGSHWLLTNLSNLTNYKKKTIYSQVQIMLVID